MSILHGGQFVVLISQLLELPVAAVHLYCPSYLVEFLLVSITTDNASLMQLSNPIYTGYLGLTLAYNKYTVTRSIFGGGGGIFLLTAGGGQYNVDNTN